MSVNWALLPWTCKSVLYYWIRLANFSGIAKTSSKIITLTRGIFLFSLFFPSFPNACFCLRFLVSVLVLFFHPFFKFYHTLCILCLLIFLILFLSCFLHISCSFLIHCSLTTFVVICNIIASFNVYFQGSVDSRYLTVIKISRCISETRISIEVNFEKAT